MDAIFNINYSESDKIGKLVIETYEGKIKKIKSKTFTGQLIRSQLKEKSYDNLTKNQINKINSILDKCIDTKLSKNKIIIKSEAEDIILKTLMQYSILYCTHKNKKMYLIEQIYFLSIKDDYIVFKKIRERYKFSINNISFSIKNKNDFINLNKKTLVLYSNSLIVLNNRFNSDFIKNKCSVWKKEYGVGRDKELEYIRPKGNLYIEFNKNKILGKLLISYKEVEIEFNSNIEKVKGIAGIYCRNLNAEEKIFNYIQGVGWKYKGKGYFENTIIDSRQIDLFNKNDISIFIKDNNKVVSAGKFNISIKNNIDWFDINAEVYIDDKVYNLYNLLKNRKNLNYIEIDEQVILIPQDIKNLMSISKISKNNIKVEKKFIGDIVALESNIKTNIYNNIFDFNNVKINLYKNKGIDFRDYQIVGIRWLKYMYINRIGACLADDMGMGKTAQVIGFLSDKEYDVNNKITIIIVPKSLIINWVREIRKINNQIKIFIYYGEQKCNFTSKNKGVIITTYHTLANDIGNFLNIKFNCIVIDEIQYLKNSETKLYKTINKLKSNFKIGISGTPFENNILEIWSIMNLLNKDVLESKNEFLKKYSSNLSLLNKKLKPYFLRRMKEDFIIELPEKLEKIIYFDMNKEERILYESIKLDIKNKIFSDNRYVIKNNSIILEGLLNLRQICCHPQLFLNKYSSIQYNYESTKFEILKELVQKIINNNEKVVIFSAFTSMLEIINRWTLEMGYKTFTINGKCKNRQKIIDQFENLETCICLVSIKSGGVGLNMTSCKYAIIYDLWWNPAIINQAEDRIYRIGQKRDVIIYKLIALNTVEEKILKLNNNKNNMGKIIFEDNKSFNSINLIQDFLD